MPEEQDNNLKNPCFKQFMDKILAKNQDIWYTELPDELPRQLEAVFAPG